MSRKLLIAAAALGLVTLAAPENARAGVYFSVGVGLPFPVAVVRPAPPCYPPVYYARPVYVPPVYYGSGYYGARYYGSGPRGYKRHWRHYRGWAN